MANVQLFSRPTLINNNEDGIVDLRKHRHNNADDLVKGRTNRPTEAFWGCGVTDALNFSKNIIYRTLNAYKPPKMVMVQLIRASEGSKTCFAEDIFNKLFDDSRSPHIWYGKCKLSQRAKELTATWVKSFVDERDLNDLEAFNFFVQLFNNERTLHDHFTIEDMFQALKIGMADDLFMFEDDSDFSNCGDEYWWDGIPHRRIANRFMYFVNEDYPLNEKMQIIAEYHMTGLHGAKVQDLFAQEEYLSNKGHSDCRSMLIDAYAKQNDPLSTPIYPLSGDHLLEPNWLFLAEAYQVSNLWCKTYGF